MELNGVSNSDWNLGVGNEQHVFKHDRQPSRRLFPCFAFWHRIRLSIDFSVTRICCFDVVQGREA